VGQIAMLRRLAGCPLRGENYFTADIAAGRVGPEQAKPKMEFE
jgi:predicted small lipoprotein YifL